jgi:hypothetical protein
VTAARARGRRAVLDAVLECFARAARLAPSRTVGIQIAGHAVELRFAGDALPPRVLPALAHLAAAPVGAPALSVHLWDTASTGVTMIPPPWPLDPLGPGGIIPAAAGDGLFASVQPGNGLLQLVDVEAGVAVLWLRDAAELLRHEMAAPLRQIVAAWAEARGLCLTHGGAVARGGGSGILLGGPGGSGKSTCALLALGAGLDYLGDDYVLVDPARAWVHALYATAKLAPASRARAGALAGWFAEEPPPGEKAIAYLAPRLGEQAPRGAQLRALVLPRVGGGVATRVEPLGKAAALRGLAPSTVLQYNGDPARTLTSLRRLVDALPCHRLHLGSDAAGVAAALVGLVDGGVA